MAKTDNELAFWIPKYIMMRSTKNLSDTGLMLPQMRRLAGSQETIGWKNFMEGRVSKSFLRYRGCTSN